MLIVLSGGIDSVLTTDPRTRGEVASGIDVPYLSTDIGTTHGLRYGPHLRAVAEASEDVCFVNGIAVRTAGHVPGMGQMVRLKIGYRGNEPSILDLIGSHRDGEALRSMVAGDPACMAWAASGFRADNLMHRIYEIPPDERRMLSRVLRRQAVGLRSESKSDRALVTADNYADVAALLERIESIPPLRHSRWSTDPAADYIANGLQTALWAFQHGVTRTMLVGIGAGGAWDSHQYSTENQTQASHLFFPVFNRFLLAMKGTKTPRGSLLDHTLILTASELGRFPRLNSFQGKDHFPQIPAILAGGPLGSSRGQVFGQTDKELTAVAVSKQTGVTNGPNTGLLDLDDIGATVLWHAGLDPRVYGYHGRPLEFLGAGA